MTKRNKSEIEMESQLQVLDPGSRRYQVLKVARDFKTAWVDFAETLTLVRETHEYKQWGYPTFEAYCRREIKIRGETANKLTRSFAFLREHEPRLLEEREGRELPPLDVVDLLSKAKEKNQIKEEDWQDIRQEAFAEQPSRSQILKRLKEVEPQTFKPIEQPQIEASTFDPVLLKKATLLAERLQAVLVESGMSHRCSELVQEILVELQQKTGEHDSHPQL